jgi:hypothetical protein
MVPDSELRKPIFTVSPDVSTHDAAPVDPAVPVSPAAVRAPHADNARAVATARTGSARERARDDRGGVGAGSDEEVNGVPFAGEELRGSAGRGPPTAALTAVSRGVYTSVPMSQDVRQPVFHRSTPPRKQ